MHYYSLNKQSDPVDFKEATIRGLAPDKGLYFPSSIPKLEADFFRDITAMSDEEIAFRVIRPYAESSIQDNEIFRIVSETVNFPMPLVPVTDKISSLELFHGPTLAFKDIGARFMSRCLGIFSKERNGKVIVLVATSGDTGGAVANGFYGVEGIEVVILYPSGKVSMVQEKQLTTLGRNIHALEVEGSFDDCQQMVKKAFGDGELNRRLFLTSANSINIARWLPQQFYYFFAYKQWSLKGKPPVIAVPSGNFGNICAGILAHVSGLPVKHFIAACNANDVVPAYFQSQQYLPKKAVATISNAMDVGDPSNFVRVLELFDNQFVKLKSLVSSISVTDIDTRKTMKEVFDREGYLLDPHGAVAYFALQSYLDANPGDRGILLETAHPVKFFDVVEPVIDRKIPIPSAIGEILPRASQALKISSAYVDLVDFLGKF